MSRLPDGLVAFGPQANCTLELCPIEWSVLRYQPSIPASGIFIALFALGLIVHAIQGVRWRTWGFMASMIAGCILEIVGYVGRLFIHDNPFDFEGFLMQISRLLRSQEDLHHDSPGLLLGRYLRPSLSNDKLSQPIDITLLSSHVLLDLHSVGRGLPRSAGRGWRVVVGQHNHRGRGPGRQHLTRRAGVAGRLDAGFLLPVCRLHRHVHPLKTSPPHGTEAQGVFALSRPRYSLCSSSMCLPHCGATRGILQSLVPRPDPVHCIGIGCHGLGRIQSQYWPPWSRF